MQNLSDCIRVHLLCIRCCEEVNFGDIKAPTDHSVVDVLNGAEVVDQRIVRVVTETSSEEE